MYNRDKVLKKIELAQSIIDSDLNDSFDKLYCFATENIKEYIHTFNLDGKSLLTVGSSGDQVINAILMGCKDITLMDLNPFVKYYFNLKKAAILTLNYEQFINYFYDYGLNESLFDKKIYEKLRNKLSVIDLNSLIFWDNLYKRNHSKMIRYRLFRDNVCHKSLKDFDPYLSDEYLFNVTKIKIINVNPKFIHGNILDYDRLLINCKYDNIFLSNIYDYIEGVGDFYNFKLAIYYLIQNLNDKGKIMLSYLYDVNKNNSLIDFVDKFALEKYNVEIFKGIKGLCFNDNTKDAIITYQKTK